MNGKIFGRREKGHKRKGVTVDEEEEEWMDEDGDEAIGGGQKQDGSHEVADGEKEAATRVVEMVERTGDDAPNGDQAEEVDDEIL